MVKLFFFQMKSYDSRKCQLSDLLTVFWAFLENYPAKPDIAFARVMLGLWENSET